MGNDMYAMITAIAVAIISIIGNFIQFYMNKRTYDVRNLNQELDYIKGVLKTQGDAYKIEKDFQENKIKELGDKVAAQEKTLNANKEEILKLQRIVSRLIGNGCHIENCPSRSPYTFEEIQEITKNQNINNINRYEKNTKRNKK